jgi:isocitrate dehydrogenase kinase/phosphatase
MQVNAKHIAKTILKGFNRHYRIFLGITRDAKQRFERCEWEAERAASSERITLYNQRVRETLKILQEEFHQVEFDETLWKEVKLRYLQKLYNHYQPELAETFYNSVFTSLFHRRYYHNDNIFVRPGVSTDYLDDELTYIGYYPTRHGLTRTVRQILKLNDIDLPYEDFHRDVRRLVTVIKRKMLHRLEFRKHFQIRVLTRLFYRNKAGYIIGMGVNGAQIIPFAIPLLNNERGAIYVDTLVHEADDIANLFSFARTYFMVDTQTPSAVVNFLLRMLPTKSRADIYTSIGLQKQGKSEFYRHFLHHLKHSSDQLEIAPGIKGLVMTVFNLPSYPYVFKVINDHFAPPKKTTHKRVREKYQIIKMHDRVGRMADTLEYSYAAFPLARISDELLAELKARVASSIEIEDDMLIIRHLYIERRLDPLNLYINFPNANAGAAMLDYAQAVKDMAVANIFPGDLLLKNFGVTRHGRVIFYDYDEIEFMTDMNFRAIPEAMTPEQEMASEPWYSIGEFDAFPEEFASFITGNPAHRRLITERFGELFDPDYWRSVQQDIRQHRFRDVFPYPQQIRFKQVFAPAAAARDES